MPDDKPTCANCRFWHPFGHPPETVQSLDGDPVGLCRRFPASKRRPEAEDGFQPWEQPVMGMGDWCGQHQPHPEPSQDTETPKPEAPGWFWWAWPGPQGGQPWYWTGEDWRLYPGAADRLHAENLGRLWGRIPEPPNHPGEWQLVWQPKPL